MEVFKEQITAFGYVMDSYIHINVIWERVDRC